MAASLTKQILEPRPEVMHLPTLFRRVEEGVIRVPAFQRGLVWNNEQIRALLESVYRGFPIGSLLLWKTQAHTFQPFVPENVQMPKTTNEGDASYVLDGMQRLITLFAAFNGGGGRDDRFELEFDLEDRKFYHSRRRPEQISPTRLKLSRVFTPRSFIEDQAKLAKLENPDEWLTRAIYLHSRFQEYQLPVISIDKATLDEAVKIFMNINRGGSDLSTVDFMRALTWHGNFDLNEAVQRIKDDLPESFQPNDETIAKVIALSLGIDPIPDTILKLQDMSVSQLARGEKDAAESMAATAAFLKRSVGVASTDFLPYEGQMLVLSSALRLASKDSALDKELTQWFLASSFSEALQGRPDHFIIRLVKDAIASLRTGQLNLGHDLRLEPGDLARKQLRKGTAVSSGFFALLSLSQARSIFTGTTIAREDYLESFDSAKLTPIVSGQKAPANSQKRLVNLLLLSASEAYRSRSNSEVRERLFQVSEDVLESQLLDRAALDFLTTKRYDEFFEHRAKLIVDRLKRALTT